jgi:hypothetical protein
MSGIRKNGIFTPISALLGQYGNESGLGLGLGLNGANKQGKNNPLKCKVPLSKETSSNLISMNDGKDYIILY